VIRAALRAAVAVLAVGCGGSSTSAPVVTADVFACPGDAGTCPIGATCLPSGGCWDAEAVNGFEDAGCNAVACEALARSALATGDDCVQLCAGWCFSACAADPASIDEDRAQMVAESCDVGACKF
jgi:hypothetical protein